MVFELGFLYLSFNCLNCNHNPARLHQIPAVRQPALQVQEWLEHFHQINRDWPLEYSPYIPSSDPAWQDWRFARDLLAHVTRQQSRLER